MAGMIISERIPADRWGTPANLRVCLIPIMMGGNPLPSVLMPAAFAPLFYGGGGRCAMRICRHLHRRRVERLWREQSSSKKAKLMEIRHSLREGDTSWEAAKAT